MRQLGLKFWHERRKLNRRLVCFRPCLDVSLGRGDPFSNATLHLGHAGGALHCMPCIHPSCSVLKYSCSYVTLGLEMQVKCPSQGRGRLNSLVCRQICFMSSGGSQNQTCTLVGQKVNQHAVTIGPLAAVRYYTPHGAAVAWSAPTAGPCHPKEVHLKCSCSA